jgi:hypothetical protein
LLERLAAEIKSMASSVIVKNPEILGEVPVFAGRE